jgi:hypothetical protein
MSVRLIDFAFSRPAPSAIKQAGYAGVIRYLSSDATKAISPAEAASYHAEKLTVTLVYEDGAADAEGGASTGAAKDRPVYFAVDENLVAAKYPGALACIDTFAKDLAHPPACYGPRPFLAYVKAHGVTYLYETSAASWNTGPEPTGVQLHQDLAQVSIDGDQVDQDIASATDYGQWPYRPPSPVPPPSPPPPEVTVQIHPISITTDANGAGFVETSIPWTTFVAVAHEGTTQATHFAAGEAHVAEVNANVAVSVTGAVKNGVAIVLVTATK